MTIAPDLQFSDFVMKGLLMPLKAAMRKPGSRSIGNWLAFYDACELAHDVRYRKIPLEITEATHGR